MEGQEFVSPWYIYYYDEFFLNHLSSVVNSLEPEWASAATAVKEQTKGKVRLGAVDATVHQVLSSRYGVSSCTNTI